MKKEGIMRINSYNKFFAKVAEIMNTSIKAVKQLEGRYKVELANHVYLNVYRGVDGSMFIHDHRGIAHITSCYDFEDFKTMKDLYERLVTDYSESDTAPAETEEAPTTHDTSETLPHVDIDCSNLKKVPKNCLYGMFGGFPSISEMYNDKCFCCIADRKGNECKGKETCGKTWKRYEAIIKPEWYHVSLATLANLDFDMLDEKRQRYLTVYREMQETLTRLRKCKTLASYDKCYMHFMRRKNTMWAIGEISNEMWHYIERKFSMQNVESGIWGSYNEEATGYHKSRRYNKK